MFLLNLQLFHFNTFVLEMYPDSLCSVFFSFFLFSFIYTSLLFHDVNSRMIIFTFKIITIFSCFIVMHILGVRVTVKSFLTTTRPITMIIIIKIMIIMKMRASVIPCLFMNDGFVPSVGIISDREYI